MRRYALISATTPTSSQSRPGALKLTRSPATRSPTAPSPTARPRSTRQQYTRATWEDPESALWADPRRPVISRGRTSEPGGRLRQRSRVGRAGEVVRIDRDRVGVADVERRSRRVAPSLQARAPCRRRARFELDLHRAAGAPRAEVSAADVPEHPPGRGDRGPRGLTPMEHARQQLQQDLRLAVAAHRPEHHSELARRGGDERGRERVGRAPAGAVL